MNGKQLKNSILQWAIQGKLVPQDPNDEPASVLLEKIRQEKERLIKEKKIKRDKNASIIYRGEDNSYYEKLLATGEVKCIDEEIPFDIPQGWEWCRIGNIFWVTKLAGFEYTKFFTKDAITSTNTVPIVRAQNVRIGKFIENKNEAISITLSNQLERSSLIKRCLLMTFIGAGIGDVCIFPAYRRNHLAPNVAKIEPFNNDCFLEFFLMALMSPLGQLGVNSIKKSTAQPSLSMETIRQILIPIPPLSEQERIVDKIGLVMPIIDKYSKSQELLDKMNVELNECLKKSVLQEAIQGKLVPQIAEEGTAQELIEQIKAEKEKLVKEGKLKKSALNDSVIFRGDDNKYYEQVGKKCLDITDEIPFVIPETWQWVRIRDVFQLNPKNEAEDEKLVAFIPMEKISAGYKSDFTFDTAKWGTIKKGFTHFANGDVAFAKITPCFQNRKSAIFHDLPNGIGAGTTELKVLRPYGNTINRWYLLYFLESPYFIDEATFKGTANQQRIVVGYLEDKLFPLPTQKEQQRIVAQIEKLFEQLH